jgi:type I restriction enzyme, S subunit
MVYEGDCRLGDLFQSRREKGRPGLPLLSVTMNNGLVDRENLDRKQDTNLAPEDHLLVKPGDIAYNMMRMWQGAFGLAEREGLVSPAYVILKSKPRIDPKYATYLLRTPRLRYLLWAYSYGLTDDRLRLYFDDFSAIPARIPTIESQQEIAKVLKTWDAAIAASELLVNGLGREKQALMRHWLVPHTAADWRALDWQRMPLGDLVDVDAQSLGSRTAPDYEFRYISLADVDEGMIARHLETYRFCDAPSRARRRVREDDILLATVRPGLKSYALISSEHASCIASTGFAVLSCREEILPHYLYQYLFSDDIQRQVHGLIAGSNYPAISSDDVRELLVYVPKKTVQEHLAKVLAAHDRQTTLLADSIKLMKAEKRALEQRLLGMNGRPAISQRLSQRNA